MKNKKVVAEKDIVGIVLTDTHLTRNSIEGNLSIFKQVIAKASELGLKAVHHLGDIFTNREGQPLDILVAFFMIIKMFEDAKIKLICIPGNHDKVFLNSNSSYLDIFKREYFEVIDSPEVRNFDGIDVAFIPYYKETDLYPEKLKSVISHLNKNRKTCLFTHIAVDGVINNDGSAVSNELTEDLFSSFYKVFTGHYHNRSQVGENIFYIGSAFPQNYGEDSDKGFTLLYSDGSHEYFRPEFKEYIKIEVPISQVEDFIKTKSYSEMLEDGHNVRFVLKGPDTEVKAFDRSRITILGFSVQMNSDEIQKNIEEVETTQLVSFNKSSVLSLYTEFCKENKYDKKQGLKYLNKI